MRLLGRNFYSSFSADLTLTVNCSTETQKKIVSLKNPKPRAQKLTAMDFLVYG